jgi:hypothetical protein
MGRQVPLPFSVDNIRTHSENGHGRRWWQYRTQVLNLYNAVTSQQLLFKNNIERLLDPIVTSDAQMQMLLNSPNMANSEWHNQTENLKRRLSSSYLPYMDTVLRISKTLEKLKAHLGIVGGMVYAKIYLELI